MHKCIYPRRCRYRYFSCSLSLFVYITLVLQNIFLRKNSEYQKLVHSGHIRTARSLCPSENHWWFLFAKNRGKIFKSKLSLSHIWAQTAFTGTRHLKMLPFSLPSPPAPALVFPTTTLADGCWMERFEIISVHVKLSLLLAIGFWSFNSTSQGPLQALTFTSGAISPAGRSK